MKRLIVTFAVHSASSSEVLRATVCLHLYNNNNSLFHLENTNEVQGKNRRFPRRKAELTDVISFKSLKTITKWSYIECYRLLWRTRLPLPCQSCDLPENLESKPFQLKNINKPIPLTYQRSIDIARTWNFLLLKHCLGKGGTEIDANQWSSTESRTSSRVIRVVIWIPGKTRRSLSAFRKKTDISVWTIVSRSWAC